MQNHCNGDERLTAQCIRPSAARDAEVMELLYSTVSTFSPGSKMPSSISSFRVMPPALGLPVQEHTRICTGT